MANVVYLLVLAASACIILYLLATSAPALDASIVAKSLDIDYDEAQKFVDSVPKGIRFVFPGSLEDLQRMAKVMDIYNHTHASYVMLVFSFTYLFKQTFMIPGSVFLNLLAGALFGIWIGFPLCCLLTTVGASCCYLISAHFGRELIGQLFSGKIQYFQTLVQQNEQNLTFFLLLLRMFPMTPNWLINIASPLVGIPLQQFVFTACIGLMPYIFMCVYTGGLLVTLDSLDSFFKFSTVIQFAVILVAAIIPKYFINRGSRSRTVEASISDAADRKRQ
ncbi:unnamed protein product [Bemisia tabaci]|uniref:VTT domain-containing protein n=1 Tax=Bemisia tabaci TaxID=7038 RepID=A0A9P0A1X3_BEMTA|nr:unnamed protein product [Bemisia tabaci]